MGQPVIQAKDIGVIFNAGKENESHGLKHINIEIYPEEYIIFFGPSGCGKSTLLYAISGLLTPSYGEVIVNGKEIAKLSAQDKSKFRMYDIGMVFQAFYLIPTLTVLDNVCLPRIFEGDTAKQRRHLAMKLLQRFQISEQADKYPGQLSGGQQQRVAISRSLIGDPGIILADEPVGNLDSVSSENAMKTLKDLNEIDKKTIILVTHDPNHLQYADRIFKISDGQIVDEVVQNDKRNKEKEDEGAFKMNKDKAKEVAEFERTPTELRILMRTFQGLSDAQGNVLLIPFKAKQLLAHLTNQYTERQLEVAQRYFKELLFETIDTGTLMEKLDMPYDDGGAGWNRWKSEKVVRRAEDILRCVRAFLEGQEKGIRALHTHLVQAFSLKMTEEESNRLYTILRMRVINQLERDQLYRWLDLPFNKGGLALRRSIAEKIAEEVEMIMLLKYS